METARLEFWAWDTVNERMVDGVYRFEPSSEYHKMEGNPVYNTPYIFYENWNDDEDGVWGPCFILQCTGKVDKKGVKIFEGHICRWPSGNLSVIKWMEDRASFSAVPINGRNTGRYGISTAHIEVIGHVFTHPELLINKEKSNK